MVLANDAQPGRMGAEAANKTHTLPTYTTTTLPSAAGHPQRLIWVSNGNAGAPCLAVSNGTSWLRIVPGAAVAAT